MAKPVFIRGQAISTAMGRTPADIVARFRSRIRPVGQMELVDPGHARRRPVYRLADSRHLPLSGPESREEFYRPLFDTAEAALEDADERRADFPLLLALQLSVLQPNRRLLDESAYVED